jgi:hypothetical protein
MAQHLSSYRVPALCEALQVSRSGIYRWKSVKHEVGAVDKAVSTAFAHHNSRAGAPCLTADVRATGVLVSERTGHFREIKRGIMKLCHQLRPVCVQRLWRTRHHHQNHPHLRISCKQRAPSIGIAGTGHADRIESSDLRMSQRASTLFLGGISIFSALPCKTLLFSKTARNVLAPIVSSRLETHVKAQPASPSYRDYISALKHYLILFCGSDNVDSITPAVVTQFQQWRREHAGRELSGSAQNNHNAAFNLVFDQAIERSDMNENQRTPQ